MTVPAPGTELELTVDRMAHGGVGVARHDGRVVFVADAIPGETVRARLTETRKKSFWRADTIAVLTPSEHRRPHVWAEAAVERDPADRAGGADFGHIALEHQRELKRRVLVESMARMGRVDLEDGSEHPAAGVRVQALPGDDAANGLGW
ncbi:MAG TPA: TRAM domain-containing protein, partial [Microcella sp.]|nr:TRAM domain-containing protein [Microcella sp.]